MFHSRSDYSGILKKKKNQLTYGGSAKDHLVSHAIHIKTKIQC